MLVMCKTDSVMRYCVANNFLCSCVYDRVCMDHESATNYYYYIIISVWPSCWPYGWNVCLVVRLEKVPYAIFTVPLVGQNSVYLLHAELCHSFRGVNGSLHLSASKITEAKRLTTLTKITCDSLELGRCSKAMVIFQTRFIFLQSQFFERRHFWMIFLQTLLKKEFGWWQFFFNQSFVLTKDFQTCKIDLLRKRTFDVILFTKFFDFAQVTFCCYSYH